MGENLLNKKTKILHACPECDFEKGPKPFCTVCLGAGAITEQRLAMWVRQMQQYKEEDLPPRSFTG